MISDTVLYKRCARCKEQKHATEFGRDNRNESGRTSFCRDCEKVRNRDRYQRKKSLMQEMIESGELRQ